MFEQVRALREFLPESLRQRRDLPHVCPVGVILRWACHRPRIAETCCPLANEHRKLEELTVGDVAVRASIELTYAALSRSQQETLSYLAQVNTVDVAPWALAALVDTSPADATKLLDDLAELHRLFVRYTDNAAPRYRMHDLVAAFARDKAAQTLTPVETERARLRMLGGALGLACAAGIRINTDFDEVPFAPPPWSFSDQTRDTVLDDPLAWFRDEYGFLKTLAEDMLPSVPLPAAGLIVALAPFMQLSGYFDDWLHLHSRALGSVTGGPVGASLRRNLGELSTIVDDYPAAERHYRAAIEMLEPSDKARIASTSAGLAYLYRLQSVASTPSRPRALGGLVDRSKGVSLSRSGCPSSGVR